MSDGRKKKSKKVSTAAGSGASAAKGAQDAAKKIGELQKQLRSEEKKLKLSLKKVEREAKKVESGLKLTKRARDTYDTREPTMLFVGGRKENSLSENIDDPWTAEDLMLSRKAVLDKEANLALYHKRGPKKGEVKFRGWSGGWKERNTAKLKPYIGKEITIKISYEKNKQGRTTLHTTTRTIRYDGDYAKVVSAYADAFRSDVVETDSDASYGVQFVEFVPPPKPTKRTRKRATGKAKAGKAKAATKKKATKATKRKKKTTRKSKTDSSSKSGKRRTPTRKRKR